MEVQEESDLYDLSTDGTITLESDIYITDDFNTIDTFTGVLDGNGHTIYNLDKMFIKEICDGAVIKNVQFKNVQFEESRGIVGVNHGEVKSVSVVDLSRSQTQPQPEMDKEKRSVGGIIGFNTGLIQKCSITNFSISSPDIVGGIVGFSIGGTIVSCTVDGSSKQDNFRVSTIGTVPCGCICSLAENETSISNCTVSNISLRKNATTLGGIVGEGDSIIIKDSTVSDIDIKSRGYDDFGGIAVKVSGSDSIVKGCTVHKIKINGLSRVMLVGSMSDKSLMKNCNAEGFTIKSNLTKDLSIAISDCGKIKNCFGRNIQVKSRTIKIESGDIVTNCMLDISVSVANSISVDSSDSKNSFINVSRTNLSHSGSVEIASKSELSDSMRDSIITLVDDIDMKGEKIPIEIFTGELHGNGHTIYNFEGTLFDIIEDAKIKNICIKGTQVTGGMLSKKVDRSKLKDIQIEIRDAEEEESGKIAPVEEAISHSTVQDCTVFITTNTSQVGVFGLSHKLTESTVRGCDFTVLVQNQLAYGISAIVYESKIKNCSCLGRLKGYLLGGVCNEVIAGELMNINCDITIRQTGHPSSNPSLSGICNNLKTGSSITNCTFSGSIHHQNDENVLGPCGGIAGIIDSKGSVSNCLNKGFIDVNSDKVGGIAGKNRDGVIQNCVNKGVIKGNNYVGGLIGLSGVEPSKTKNSTFYRKNNPKITKSGNEATVSGNNGVGGIIGAVSNTKVKNCYNYSQVAGETNKSLSIGLHRDPLAKTTIENVLVKNIENEDVEIGSATDSTLKEVSLLLGI